MVKILWMAKFNGASLMVLKCKRYCFGWGEGGALGHLSLSLMVMMKDTTIMEVRIIHLVEADEGLDGFIKCNHVLE